MFYLCTMTKTKEIEDIIGAYQYLFDDGLVNYSQTKYTWNFTIKHQRDSSSKYVLEDSLCEIKEKNIGSYLENWKK